MDIFNNFAVGMHNILVPYNFIMILVGLMVGVIVGALPGIAMINAMVLALPFTYSMEPVAAILLLISIYCGGMFGGAITAILINIPGSPGNAPTAIEGFALTKKGKTAQAIGTAIICSGIGGFISALVMTFVSPTLADFAMRFTSVEKFAIVFLGLTCLAGMGAESISSSLISVFAGIFLGTIGVAPLYFSYRFTFGFNLFSAGVSFIIALIGLFAVSEILHQAVFRIRYRELSKKSAGVKLPGLREIWRLRGTVTRATIIGTGIGVIPGEGGAVAAFLSYGIERQISNKGEDFGTGVIQGLAAPETANNASTGGAMIPLLTLGIPGSGAAAVILGAFLLHGLQPGPLLFINQLDLVYTIFIGMLLVNILMIFSGTITTKIFLQAMRIPEGVMGSFIMVLCFIGAYGLRNNIGDVWLMMCFGLLGFFMRRYRFPIIPMVMGIILGPLAETYFLTSMIKYDNDISVFFTRPISLCIICFAVLLLFLPYLAKKIGKRVVSPENK